MAPPPIVEFRNVSKRYGDGPVILDDIHFSAQAGDFISFIGPSGCGKSTLLKLIAGLNPVTSGHLQIHEQAAAGANAEIAFVFQEPALLPWLTTVKNIEVPLQLRGTPVPQRQQTARDMLELVRLSDKADAYPRQLSGGQKMRVSLARALSLSPRVLLLDEPFGALDEMTREHLNEELLAIRERKSWTAFFVTHSVTEAVFLSNRIFVLAPNLGRIHREIQVDLPYPRTAATRLSSEFQSLVAETSQLLRSVENSAAKST